MFASNRKGPVRNFRRAFLISLGNSQNTNIAYYLYFMPFRRLVYIFNLPNYSFVKK